MACVGPESRRPPRGASLSTTSRGARAAGSGGLQPARCRTRVPLALLPSDADATGHWGGVTRGGSRLSRIRLRTPMAGRRDVLDLVGRCARRPTEAMLRELELALDALCREGIYGRTDREVCSTRCVRAGWSRAGNPDTSWTADVEAHHASASAGGRPEAYGLVFTSSHSASLPARSSAPRSMPRSAARATTRS